MEKFKVVFYQSQKNKKKQKKNGKQVSLKNLIHSNQIAEVMQNHSSRHFLVVFVVSNWVLLFFLIHGFAIP